LSLAAFAQTYSNASLSGSYTTQTTQAQYGTWQKSANCTYNGNTVTASGGGQTVSTRVGNGVLTFDGIGNVSGSYAQAGNFNQTKSNATVFITFSSTCVPTINNGRAVFDAATTSTVTATYQVQSTGSGSMTVTGSKSANSFQLAATTPTTNISNTIFFTFFGSNPTTQVNSTGLGVRQLI